MKSTILMQGGPKRDVLDRQGHGGTVQDCSMCSIDNLKGGL